MSQSVSPETTTWTFGFAHDEGVGAIVGVGLGAAVEAGVGAGVGAVDAAFKAAGDALGNAGVAVELGVVIGTGRDDPAGVGMAGVAAHAASRTPRRRDAARRFAFICRRRWRCGLSRR